MASLLEELKQQREQIQKHLAWIDAKIAELSKKDEGEESDKNVASTATAQECVARTEPPSPPEANNEEPLPYEPNLDASAYKAKTQSELHRAKIGCLVLFVLGCALFLFLLFGLPYLL